jgi:hypothetical protein
MRLNVSHVIHVPSGHVIMVSMWNYGCRVYDLNSAFFSLIISNPQQGEEIVEPYKLHKKSAFLYNASLLTVVLSGVVREPHILAFQLYYSFHSEDKVPYKANITTHVDHDPLVRLFCGLLPHVPKALGLQWRGRVCGRRG